MKPIRLAFNHRMISFNVNEVPSCESDIMDAYNAGDTNDLKFSEASVTEGLKLFQETWGFASATAIPPCYFGMKLMNRSYVQWRCNGHSGHCCTEIAGGWQREMEEEIPLDRSKE